MGRRLDKKRLSQKIERFKRDIEVYSEEMKDASDGWWAEVSEEEREYAFLSVISRLYAGVLVENKSIHDTISDTFDFDEPITIACISCGFDEIYNRLRNE